jgi:amidase
LIGRSRLREEPPVRVFGLVVHLTVVTVMMGGAACARSDARPISASYSVENKSLETLRDDLVARRVTSRQLVELYLERIRTIDQSGPALRSVLAVNPRALDEATRLDNERAGGRTRGPLHGIPILVKDNIETADPIATTAGSLALEKNVTGRDAPIINSLREAGAVILGKTNLSEWANFRSAHSTSGWSAVGGLTRNPYALDRNACGSSSGSAVAVAASLAAVAVGTETDGSVTCPAAVNGIVGLKPTVGLLSRRYIVPISSMQDTAGPMAHSVADAAAMLSAMAGTDDKDPATKDADAHRTDYTAALSADGLSGKRLGVMRFSMGYLPALDAQFELVVRQLTASGAEVVSIDKFEGMEQIEKTELTILLTDFRSELDAYLATTPHAVTVRTLQDLIGFNRANSTSELSYFGQDLFERSEETAEHDQAAYTKLREGNRKAARDGIDALLKEHKLDALIAPTLGPAWTTDLVNGDHVTGSATTLAAVAGYPHLTVPMGQLRGLPVGLSFIGPAWSESTLLAMGHAFELTTHAARPPVYRASAEP